MASAQCVLRDEDDRGPSALGGDRDVAPRSGAGAAFAYLRLAGSARLDVRPRSDENPTDPGAAVYFSFKDKATVLAGDRFLRVAYHIAAIAGHIEALRRVERYGVGTIEQALAGYKALPADTAANWRVVFGFTPESTPTLDQVDSAVKAAARQRHPDLGGTDIEMAHVKRGARLRAHGAGVVTSTPLLIVEWA